MKISLFKRSAGTSVHLTSKTPSSWPRRWLLAGLALIAPQARRVSPTAALPTSALPTSALPTVALIERDGWLLKRDDS